MARRLIFHRSVQKQPLPIGIKICIGFGACIAMIAGFLWIGITPSAPGTLDAGVTFSIPYAEELHLNWRETLTATLDDLHVRLFRIPAYWSVVEPNEGQYDWSTIDYQMDEIAARHGQVILGVGAKLPRWPECWIPDWAIHKGLIGEREARLQYIEQTVLRYRDHKALAMWQVENEPLFKFGLCPQPSMSFLKQEVDLVRRLDIHHPISSTDSGELSDWIRVGSLVDHLGVSTYRVVKTFWGATWEYNFLPTYWYARRADLIRAFVQDVYVSEFQMEPWSDHSLQDTPIAQQVSFFGPDRMQKNFAYAERMGLDSVSFWGVEWWYWMKTQQHDPRYWNIAKIFFARHADDIVSFP
ncbi:MAG: beta-galactosidase [Patescibacteria group bacterium]